MQRETDIETYRVQERHTEKYRDRNSDRETQTPRDTKQSGVERQTTQTAPSAGDLKAEARPRDLPSGPDLRAAKGAWWFGAGFIRGVFGGRVGRGVAWVRRVPRVGCGRG